MVENRVVVRYRSRRLQFSLRTMLLVTTLVAVVLSWRSCKKAEELRRLQESSYIEICRWEAGYMKPREIVLVAHFANGDCETYHDSDPFGSLDEVELKTAESWRHPGTGKFPLVSFPKKPYPEYRNRIPVGMETQYNRLMRVAKGAVDKAQPWRKRRIGDELRPDEVPWPRAPLPLDFDRVKRTEDWQSAPLRPCITARRQTWFWDSESETAVYHVFYRNGEQVAFVLRRPDDKLLEVCVNLRDPDNYPIPFWWTNLEHGHGNIPRVPSELLAEFDKVRSVTRGQGEPSSLPLWRDADVPSERNCRMWYPQEGFERLDARFSSTLKSKRRDAAE